MKITIEPTTEFARNQHKIIIETPHDELNIDEVFRFLGYALMAYGFSPANVAEYLDEEES